MKQKHVTINRLIKENGFVNYLEIGYGKGNNFRLIECEHKVGIDPDITEENLSDDFSILKRNSDEFFEEMGKSKTKFDIVLIDGLHHADQVERDILNAWDRTKVGGFILLYDIVPPSEVAQRIPRQQEQWTGDVWRSYVGFRMKYPDVDSRYYPEKYGLGCIVRSRHKVEPGFVESEMKYSEFEANRAELLGTDDHFSQKYL